MLSTQTATARSISATRRATLSTDEIIDLVKHYLLLSYSEDVLDQMSSTEEAREEAAEEIVLGSQINRELDLDQAELLEQFKRFSPNPGCWRSLVREVLADRRRHNVASA